MSKLRLLVVGAGAVTAGVSATAEYIDERLNVFRGFKRYFQSIDFQVRDLFYVSNHTATSDKEVDDSISDRLSFEQQIQTDQKLKGNGNSDDLRLLTSKLLEVKKLLGTIHQTNNDLILPSIVVIGSQSSGKSSVLESIVGYEFLPKGKNMVTKRPIELTLIHAKESQVLLNDNEIELKHVKKELQELNNIELVSSEPIDLKVYSPDVPTLNLIDLPGYISITNRNQPTQLKQDIVDLCDKYIQEPNVILAISAADVDLANSEALNASRRVDPLGVRTIGIVTKMDLVDAEHGVGILQNEDYPLKMGYVGIVNGPDGDACFEAEAYKQSEARHGIETLKQILVTVLEESMGKSLFKIMNAVQSELEEARYQFKVHYNDRTISAESYFAEAMDSFKLRFKEFVPTFNKPHLRKRIRALLENKALTICSDLYWYKEDPQTTEFLFEKLNIASSALTKSGIGRNTTQLVVNDLLSSIDKMTLTDPLTHHESTRQKILYLCNDMLSSKFHTTSDQVENTIKPYKYEVECTALEWSESLAATIRLLESEMQGVQKQFVDLKESTGKSKLRSAIQHLQSTRQESDIQTSYNPALLEKARQALFMRDRLVVLKKRMATMDSSTCASPETAHLCPEVYLNVVVEKLTNTAVMFIWVELLHEFFDQYPRVLESGLILSASQVKRFADENEKVKKHLEVQGKKEKLELVMEKLMYLVKRQEEMRRMG